MDTLHFFMEPRYMDTRRKIQELSGIIQGTGQCQVEVGIFFYNRLIKCFKIFCFLKELWPNLKYLSGGLNLSRGLNMVGSA